MSALNPLHDFSILRARMAETVGLVVACYCAAWCDTCTKYRHEFDALARQWPEHVFVWIDIEENPEYMGDEDVEDFPTVSIQSTAANLFFGTLLPYADHLDRLLKNTDPSLPGIAGGPPLLRSLIQAAP